MWQKAFKYTYTASHFSNNWQVYQKPYTDVPNTLQIIKYLPELSPILAGGPMAV